MILERSSFNISNIENYTGSSNVNTKKNYEMLRIINKTAQMSLAPGSPIDAYGKPIQYIKNVVREKGENKKQREYERSIQQFEQLRDPANGPCGACGKHLAKHPGTGKRFCPGCPYSIPRSPSIRPPISR